MRSLDKEGTLPVPVASCRRWAADLTSASRRLRVTFFDAVAVPGADREDGHTLEAVGHEEAAYVVEHAGAAGLGHGVDVVEHHHHHVAVAG